MKKKRLVTQTKCSIVLQWPKYQLVTGTTETAFFHGLLITTAVEHGRHFRVSFNLFVEWSHFEDWNEAEEKERRYIRRRKRFHSDPKQAHRLLIPDNEHLVGHFLLLTYLLIS